jgi:hypothetical protein
VLYKYYLTWLKAYIIYYHSFCFHLICHNSISFSEITELDETKETNNIFIWWPCKSSLALIFFTHLPKISIYSNKLFHNFHLSKFSFTCPGSQASVLVQRLSVAGQASRITFIRYTDNQKIGKSNNLKVFESILCKRKN